MLTKDDLLQIGKVVENKIAEQVGPIVEKKLKPVKKQLKKLQRDQKIMLEQLDREQMNQRKRIIRLEEHVGIAQ